MDNDVTYYFYVYINITNQDTNPRKHAFSLYWMLTKRLMNTTPIFLLKWGKITYLYIWLFLCRHTVDGAFRLRLVRVLLSSWPLTLRSFICTTEFIGSNFTSSSWNYCSVNPCTDVWISPTFSSAELYTKQFLWSGILSLHLMFDRVVIMAVMLALENPLFKLLWIFQSNWKKSNGLTPLDDLLITIRRT